MKTSFFTLVVFILFLQIAYCQATYLDLSNYLEMDKDEISISLKKINQNWKYIESQSNSNAEKWNNNGTTITIKNFETKDRRKIEFYTNNSDLYTKIIREMGRTLQFKEAIIKETPKVVYNFWYSPSKTAVGHIICSETDTVCYLQLDLMKNIVFNQNEYK